MIANTEPRERTRAAAGNYNTPWLVYEPESRTEENEYKALTLQFKETKYFSTEPRANGLFHGIGHVLFPTDDEQYKVIDFDNASRRQTGAPERPYDGTHEDADHPAGTYAKP